VSRAGTVRWAAGAGVVALALAVPQARADVGLHSDQEVAGFFANVCGWCHEQGGRQAGKGPQLMGTDKSDDYITNRIATGKPGKMPAFGNMLDGDDIQAIIHYIRDLKPEGGNG
jgi:mono/diheme cytochrome c family protein